jgi:hypothetical protein
MRPIDAKKLRAFYRNHYGSSVSPAEIDRVDYAIACAPTIDPESLRPRGRWLTWAEKFPEYAKANKGILGVFCSACGMHSDNKTKYCHNCGAKMEDGDG